MKTKKNGMIEKITITNHQTHHGLTISCLHKSKSSSNIVIKWTLLLGLFQCITSNCNFKSRSLHWNSYLWMEYSSCWRSSFRLRTWKCSYWHSCLKANFSCPNLRVYSPGDSNAWAKPFGFRFLTFVLFWTHVRDCGILASVEYGSSCRELQPSSLLAWVAYAQ